MIGELTLSFYSLIPGLFTPRSGNSRRRQLNVLVSEANRNAASANRENSYGETAISAIEKTFTEDKPEIYRRNLSEIAAWHFRLSAEKYREAAAVFAVAAEFAVLKINRKKLQAKAVELRKRAEQAESAANSIHDF
ncbi:MAG TPA: hypothetical protein VF596_19410 [Pyrinomonadaceae bacterium]|jgi:hypothetical protein